METDRKTLCDKDFKKHHMAISSIRQLVTHRPAALASMAPPAAPPSPQHQGAQ
jgi:hypothetical protein